MQVTACDFVPSFGHDKSYLSPKGCAIHVIQQARLGSAWLESSFLDPRNFCGTCLETQLISKVGVPGILFFIYAPLEESYFAFQLRKGSVEVIIAKPHAKYLSYRRKIQRYRSLALHPSWEIYLDWKNQCSWSEFTNYCLYRLWRRQSQAIDDYLGFLHFRQACRIKKEGNLLYIQDRHYRTVCNYYDFKHKRGSYEDWQKFCQWKENYYIHRSLCLRDKVHLIRKEVARCQKASCLSFIVRPEQIIWRVDGYNVYSYIPPSLFLTCHLGIGVSGESCFMTCGKIATFRGIKVSEISYCTEETSSCEESSSCAPLSQKTCPLIPVTTLDQTSTVQYRHGHPLSKGAETTSLNC